MKDKPESMMQEYDGDVDLVDVARTLWAGKWVIGGLAILAAIVALIIALTSPNVYKAEALLSPNHQDRAGGLAGLASQYSGFAGLAGIDFRAGPTDKTTLAIQVLRSGQFISNFVQRHDLLVPLMAGEGWDPESGKVLIDKDDYDQSAKQWVRKVKAPKTPVPSMQEAREAYLDIVDVSQDKDTGFVSISVEHYSPLIAQAWVELLVSDINKTILDQDVTEAESAIAFLRKQIESTSLSEMQAVFFNLIEDQMKTVMLANATPEYVFRTIDPAVVPEKKIRPRRSLLVAAGFIAGLFTGVLFWLGRTGLRPRASSS